MQNDEHTNQPAPTLEVAAFVGGPELGELVCPGCEAEGRVPLLILPVRWVPIVSGGETRRFCLELSCWPHARPGLVEWHHHWVVTFKFASQVTISSHRARCHPSCSLWRGALGITADDYGLPVE